MENYELQTIEEPDEGVPFDILLNKIDNSILEIVTCPICKNIGWNIINASNIFSSSYDYIKQYTDLVTKINDNLYCIFFYSERSSAGCAFRYINKSKCIFDCIIFGPKDKEELYSDITEICNWLDIFVINDIPNEYAVSSNIAVFYGRNNKLPIVLDYNNKILMVKNRQEKITRTIRYLMRIRAPVHQSDTIGWVFYKTSLFDNPIKYTLKAKYIIQKGGLFNNLLDSIHYIIYNSPHNI